MSDDRLRIDKWLWYARFLKTRSLAAALVEAGEVTVNETVVIKTSQALKPGDVVTLRLGKRWRRVRVLALGERRGPAPEAQALYEEMEAPVVSEW
jgi:ribosome-associated heat shock protein Hsp15